MFAAVLELNSKVRYGMTSRGVPLFRAIPFQKGLPPVIAGCSERDLSKPLIGLFSVEDWKTPYQPGGRYPRANLVRPLGRAGDPQAELQALLATYAGRTTGRSPPLVEHSSGHGSPLAPRRMLPSKDTFHIDPAGCRDIDDVITVTQLSPSHWEIAISIADVAERIPVDSPADIYAKELGATFYDPDGRVLLPMLHPQLSEDELSLRPHQTRNALSRIYIWNHEARQIESMSWELTSVCVGHSYSYEHANTLFNTDPFQLLRAFTQLSQEHDSHVLVERLMLRYNADAADVLKNAGRGILRKQDAAEATATATLQKLGAPLFLAQKAAAYCEPTDDRTSHTGMGLDAYAHVSSPLRRYVDIVNQRALKAILFDAESPPFTQSSQILPVLNKRARMNKQFSRDAFFLMTLSTAPSAPVKAICIEISPETRKGTFYVEAWRRCVRVKECSAELQPMTSVVLHWYADQTQVSWKERMVFRLSSC